MAIYSLCVMKYALDAECLRRYVRRRYCVGIIVNRKQKKKKNDKTVLPELKHRKHWREREDRGGRKRYGNKERHTPAEALDKLSCTHKFTPQQPSHTNTLHDRQQLRSRYEANIHDCTKGSCRSMYQQQTYALVVAPCLYVYTHKFLCKVLYLSECAAGSLSV